MELKFKIIMQATNILIQYDQFLPPRAFYTVVDYQDELLDENNIEYILNRLNLYINNNNIELDRGDIIDTIPEDIRYRNEGKFIWTGIEAIELSSDVDEYGAVPNSFIVSNHEFSITYWMGTINHNYYYFPCQEWRIELCESLQFNSLYTNEDEWHGFFMYRGEPHIVFISIYSNDNSLSIDKIRSYIMNYKVPFSCELNEIDLKDNFAEELESRISEVTFRELEEDEDEDPILK